MAKTFEEFVRSDLPRRLRRIERIELAVSHVLESFHKLYDIAEKRWPYEVEHQATPSSPGRSDSTNAMVQFMLSVFTRSPGRTRSAGLVTPLLGRVHRVVKVPNSLNESAQASRNSLETHYATAPNTESKSFGGNDPLTLCWLLESEIPLQTGLMSAVDALLTTAIAQPSEYRLNRGDNRADAHAFPLLRISHLAQKLVPGKSFDFTALRAWFLGTSPPASLICKYSRHKF